MKKLISVSAVTPKGISYSGECDDIVFTTPDSADGRGGGSIAIHSGHISSVIALAEGEVKLYRENALVAAAEVGGGFVTVADDKLSFITDKFILK